MRYQTAILAEMQLVRRDYWAEYEILRKLWEESSRRSSYIPAVIAPTNKKCVVCDMALNIFARGPDKISGIIFKSGQDKKTLIDATKNPAVAGFFSQRLYA